MAPGLELAALRPIGVITNPRARKNVGRAERPERLASLLGAAGVVHATRTLEELAPAVEDLVERGARCWVVDGGDGSLHWVLNAVVDRYGLGELSRRVPLAVPANGGTIDFVARHAGVRGTAEGLVGRLVRAGTGPIAQVPTLVARGERERPDGGREPFLRVGFAAAVAGIGNGFFEHYDRSGRGRPAIVVGVAKAAGALLLDLGPWRRLAPRRWLDYGRVAMGRVPARVVVDGEALPYTAPTALHVGAVPIDLGGLVKVFGHAGPGRLHANAGELGVLGMIANLPRLATGRALRAAGLWDGPVARVRVEATGPAPLRPVIDGERFEGLRWLELEPGPAIAVPRLDGRRP